MGFWIARKPDQLRSADVPLYHMWKNNLVENENSSTYDDFIIISEVT